VSARGTQSAARTQWHTTHCSIFGRRDTCPTFGRHSPARPSCAQRPMERAGLLLGSLQSTGDSLRATMHIQQARGKSQQATGNRRPNLAGVPFPLDGRLSGCARPAGGRRVSPERWRSRLARAARCRPDLGSRGAGARAALRPMGPNRLHWAHLDTCCHCTGDRLTHAEEVRPAPVGPLLCLCLKRRLFHLRDCHRTAACPVGSPSGSCAPLGHPKRRFLNLLFLSWPLPALPLRCCFLAKSSRRPAGRACNRQNNTSRRAMSRGGAEEERGKKRQMFPIGGPRAPSGPPEPDERPRAASPFGFGRFGLLLLACRASRPAWAQRQRLGRARQPADWRSCALRARARRPTVRRTQSPAGHTEH